MNTGSSVGIWNRLNDSISRADICHTTRNIMNKWLLCIIKIINRFWNDLILMNEPNEKISFITVAINSNNRPDKCWTNVSLKIQCVKCLLSTSRLLEACSDDIVKSRGDVMESKIAFFLRYPPPTFFSFPPKLNSYEIPNVCFSFQNGDDRDNKNKMYLKTGETSLTKTRSIA